jgi:hypothetical protein
MKQPSVLNGSQTFADFLYAVVVGVAFSHINLTDPVSILFSTFFLLAVVLEDFWLYQTQVKPHTDVYRFTNLTSMIFEVLMLLAWFLSFLSRENEPRIAFACLAAFFFLKWLASSKHLLLERLPASKRWVIHRDHLFLFVVIASLVFALKDSSGVTFLDRGPIEGKWIIVSGVWGIQTVIWWIIATSYAEPETSK